MPKTARQTTFPPSSRETPLMNGESSSFSPPESTVIFEYSLWENGKWRRTTRNKKGRCVLLDSPAPQSSGYHFSSPGPPISLVISSIRSRGNGGEDTGLMAIDMSFIGLSSAATRFELNVPQYWQRWMTAHSPLFRTQTATGSMTPPQSEARSPGRLSTFLPERQWGQWFR